MSIEQHPIPQDVAGYKFRLIGDMTVKQFIWLAGGIILGLVSYSLPLPFFFKYPLVAIFVCLGAGIAFLPIEGRPMDKWLIAFIKSVYSPTEYTWQKTAPNALETTTPIMTARAPIATVVPVTPVSAPTTVVSTPTPAPIIPTTTPSTPAIVQPIVVETPQSIVDTQIKPVEPQRSTIESRSPASPGGDPSVARSDSVDAKGGSNLPIPFTPTTPNTLVGMTLTPDSRILDGCLIEIKSNGISIRATKSNQLGQFLFAKPLENGQYQILTEKPGFSFDIYSLNLTGQIVKPLRLQAKNNV